MVTKEAPLPNQAITSNEMKNFESIEIENNNTKYLLKLFNNENNLGFLIEKINLFPKNEYYYEMGKYIFDNFLLGINSPISSTNDISLFIKEIFNWFFENVV